MIKSTWSRRAGVGAALLLALSVTTLAPTAAAQEGSPSGSGAASPSAQASAEVVQTNHTTDVPWGLLGLLGLGGLAGLRRRPEPVRDGPTTVGVYDTTQQR